MVSSPPKPVAQTNLQRDAAVVEFSSQNNKTFSNMSPQKQASGSATTSSERVDSSPGKIGRSVSNPEKGARGVDSAMFNTTIGVPSLKHISNLSIADFEPVRVEPNEAAYDPKQGQEDLLGLGSFGSVRKVRYKNSRYVYALKKMDIENVNNGNLSNQVEREIAVQREVDHPNILQLKADFRDIHNIYLLLEHCPNGELYQSLRKNGYFSETQSCRYFKHVSYGLQYLHERGIVHRDLKPENLLVSSDDIIKIADFGWCALETIGRKRTTFCGTLDYLAPEMISGEGHDRTLDVWMAGVLLYEMVKGKPPFASTNHALLVMRVLTLDIQWQNGNANISDQVKDVIRRILVTDPRKRVKLPDLDKHEWLVCDGKVTKSEEVTMPETPPMDLRDPPDATILLPTPNHVPRAPESSGAAGQRFLPPPRPANPTSAVSSTSRGSTRNDNRNSHRGPFRGASGAPPPRTNSSKNVFCNGAKTSPKKRFKQSPVLPGFRKVRQDNQNPITTPLVLSRTLMQGTRRQNSSANILASNASSSKIGAKGAKNADGKSSEKKKRSESPTKKLAMQGSPLVDNAGVDALLNNGLSELYDTTDSKVLKKSTSKDSLLNTKRQGRKRSGVFSSFGPGNRDAANKSERPVFAKSSKTSAEQPNSNAGSITATNGINSVRRSQTGQSQDRLSSNFVGGKKVVLCEAKLEQEDPKRPAGFGNWPQFNTSGNLFKTPQSTLLAPRELRPAAFTPLVLPRSCIGTEEQNVGSGFPSSQKGTPFSMFSPGSVSRPPLRQRAAAESYVPHLMMMTPRTLMATPATTESQGITAANQTPGMQTTSNQPANQQKPLLATFTTTFNLKDFRVGFQRNNLGMKNKNLGFKLNIPKLGLGGSPAASPDVQTLEQKFQIHPNLQTILRQENEQNAAQNAATQQQTGNSNVLSLNMSGISASTAISASSNQPAGSQFFKGSKVFQPQSPGIVPRIYAYTPLIGSRGIIQRGVTNNAGSEANTIAVNSSAASNVVAANMEKAASKDLSSKINLAAKFAAMNASASAKKRKSDCEIILEDEEDMNVGSKFTCTAGDLAKLAEAAQPLDRVPVKAIIPPIDDEAEGEEDTIPKPTKTLQEMCFGKRRSRQIGEMSKRNSNETKTSNDTLNNTLNIDTKDSKQNDRRDVMTASTTTRAADSRGSSKNAVTCSTSSLARASSGSNLSRASPTKTRGSTKVVKRPSPTKERKSMEKVDAKRNTNTTSSNPSFRFTTSNNTVANSNPATRNNMGNNIAAASRAASVSHTMSTGSAMHTSGGNSLPRQNSLPQNEMKPGGSFKFQPRLLNLNTSFNTNTSLNTTSNLNKTGVLNATGMLNTTFNTTNPLNTTAASSTTGMLNTTNNLNATGLLNTTGAYSSTGMLNTKASGPGMLSSSSSSNNTRQELAPISFPTIAFQPLRAPMMTPMTKFR